MADLTVSSNVDSLMQAADFATFRTTLGLTSISTVIPGTGVNTALAVGVGSTGAFVVLNGALGTPSSGNLTSCTGYNVGGLTGSGSGINNFLMTPSSANLATAMTDETGSGPLVFANIPTLTTPIFSGIYTYSGSAVRTGSAMGALAVDVTKGVNTKTITVDSTLTFSGAPATANTWFSMLLTNSDTASHVITIPSSFSIGRNSSITSFTIPISGKLFITWQYDGSAYNIYGDPPATSGTGAFLLANGPVILSSDGVTNLNNIVTTIAAGTAYTLTATNADVTFGTTNPTVTLNQAGTYELYATIQVNVVGATYASAFQTVTCNLRRTNNTAADLSGSTFGTTVNMVALTTQTYLGPAITISLGKYTTTNTNDVIGLRGILSSTPAAGSITISAATVTAARLY